MYVDHCADLLQVHGLKGQSRAIEIGVLDILLLFSEFNFVFPKMFIAWHMGITYLALSFRLVAFLKT